VASGLVGKRVCIAPVRSHDIEDRWREIDGKVGLCIMK